MRKGAVTLFMNAPIHSGLAFATCIRAGAVEGKKYGDANGNERSLNEESFASDRNKNWGVSPVPPALTWMIGTMVDR